MVSPNREAQHRVEKYGNVGTLVADTPQYDRTVLTIGRHAQDVTARCDLSTLSFSAKKIYPIKVSLLKVVKPLGTSPLTNQEDK